MKNVLYIGNALHTKGKTITTIDSLSKHLREISQIQVASNKSNKVLRLLDMVFLVIANRRKTDYVLIDTYSTVNFYYALIISQLCRLFKLKYVNILHGGNLEYRLKNSPRLCRFIFANAHQLVAPSQFLKFVFDKYGYKKVLHIPNTIEIDHYKYKVRKINEIKLLWVRSFSSIYNPLQAVLVFEELKKRGYNTELTMIGPEVDGSLSKTKKIVKEKNLEVRFTGKLSKTEWIALSKDYNVFINTTNFDNTPVSVIEAMALGLPVVSTNVGGLPFLISNEVDGLLVTQNDVKAMVNAIVKLKQDEVLKYELVNNAREKVEGFDWYAVKPKWEKLLC